MERKRNDRKSLVCLHRILLSLIIDAHAGGAGGSEQRVELILKFLGMLHIDRAITWNIPRNKAEMGKNNDTTARFVAQHKDNLIGFASVNPNAKEEAIRELSRAIKELGLVGLKIHPLVSKVPINHPSVLALVETAKDLDIPVLFHVDSPDLHTANETQENVDREWNLASSHLVDDVVAIYNSPKIWCAHMGGVTRKSLQESKVSFQTTGCSVATIEHAVDVVGPDRIMYGSDYPFFSPMDEIAKVWRASISDTARTNILGGNVQRLLGL